MTIHSRQIFLATRRLRAAACAILGAHVLSFAGTALATNYVATDLYTATPRPSGLVDVAVGGQMASNVSDGVVPSRATIWNGPAGAAVDLHPAQFEISSATATDGNQQVGYGKEVAFKYHALLWSGSAASMVDLSPSGFDISLAQAVEGGHQLGGGIPPGGNGFSHALLWSGTAASVVDLNPTGFLGSVGEGLRGDQQVGVGSIGTEASHTDHALLWNGTAASAIDLHPAGYARSIAFDVRDGQQVGQADVTPPVNHAMLWSGTAASAVDLHPLGFDTSTARDVLGGVQVGWGDTSASIRHALAWTGTAASVIDLQQFLPADYLGSQAFSIDAAGNIFGIGIDGSSNIHAIEWSPIPEPASLALLAAGGLLLPLVLRYRGGHLKH